MMQDLLAGTPLHPDPQLELPTGLADSVWRQGRRRRSARLASLAAGTACIAAAAGLAVSQSGGSVERLSVAPVSKASPSTQPSPSRQAGAPGLVCPSYPKISPCPDPALAAVGLPDPLPGYPHRIDWGVLLTNEGTGRPPALERTIQVDNVPPDGGPVHGTGAYLSLRVARAGAFDSEPDASGRVDGDRVIARLPVRGVTGLLLQTGKGQSALVFTVGPFAVSIGGEEGPGHVKTHPDLPPGILVNLADAITGLPR